MSREGTGPAFAVALGVLVTLVTFVRAASPQRANALAGTGAVHRAVIDRYCVTCHISPSHDLNAPDTLTVRGVRRTVTVPRDRTLRPASAGP